MNFIHQFSPQPVLLAFGAISIYWYGLIVALGLAAGVAVAVWLGQKKGIASDDIFDLAFWLAVAGIVGARLYDVFFIDWDYYRAAPGDIIKIWQGGIAIHGAIIAATLVLWFWTKRKRFSFWRWADLLVAPLALGQAIGRWGNYFNQELFGWPTKLPWGIPIDEAKRPAEFINEKYFQPAFLYESILNLLLFCLLIVLARRSRRPGLIALIYFIGYGVIRFFMEFIRIDATPAWGGLRLPQWASVVLIFLAVVIYFNHTKKRHVHL